MKNWEKFLIVALLIIGVAMIHAIDEVRRSVFRKAQADLAASCQKKISKFVDEASKPGRILKVEEFDRMIGRCVIKSEDLNRLERSGFMPDGSR